MLDKNYVFYGLSISATETRHMENMLLPMCDTTML